MTVVAARNGRSSASRTRLRKQREHEERRREMLAAAREVFARKGYPNATLDEIAERAAYAKGTLYNYFRSKEDIFNHLLAGMIQDLHAIARSVAREEGSGRETFHRYACAAMEYYKRNEDFLRIVSFEMNTMQIEDRRTSLQRVLGSIREAASILAGTLRPELGVPGRAGALPRDLAMVFVALILNRSVRHMLQPRGLAGMNTAREAAFLTKLFFDGVSGMRGNTP